MRKFNRKIITMLILLAIIILPNTANAALQANKGGTSLVETTAADFFKAIRQMETTNGTLGTASEIDTAGGTYLDTTLNGIDCHMAKNTEWGTAAMLAASVYGTAPTGTSDASTTGNETGIYQMADSKYEYVAGIYSKDSYANNLEIIKTADARYRNLYTSSTSIAGDATLETKGWYGASNADFVTSNKPISARSSGSLFGCYNYYMGLSRYDYTSRAVVVCGAEL